ncbi:MAG: M20/M25/M40 family metallo-hydrolase, partial [Thermodesulfobacteriota bacterium]
MNAREQKILGVVDSLADEIFDLAGRLVAVESTLGREAPVVALMEKELVRLGFAPRRVPIVPQELAGHPGFAPVPWGYEGRENVVAVRPPDGEGGRSVLFNGHLDVVSPEPRAFWHRDPFTPVIEDGWMYGRGSGDMKSGVAAMTYAVHAVSRAGFGLRAPVTLSAVIEEECSGNGALATLAAGYDAEAVLIPEPFGPTIYTAQVGVLWFKVKVKGMPKHVQEAPAGANAVEKSFPLIAALRRLEEEMNREPRPGPYQDLVHPLNLNVGVFQGGDWPSTVPAAAEFRCRLSYFPGVAFDRIRG